MKILSPELPTPAPRLTSPSPARIVPFGAPPPDATDEDFADGSVEMNADGSQFRVALALQAARPLTVDRTVYVNSATGSDTNDGSQAAPFKTLGRAWQERQKHGELRAVFTIQLVGAGTYDWDFTAGASAVAGEGRFFLLGDMSAVTVLATGTITGPIVGYAIPTSAISGGPYPNEFAEILTGANAGRILQLNDSAANVLNIARSAGLAAFVNGDQFRVIRPGTRVRPVDPPGGTTQRVRWGASNWSGCQGDLTPFPLHWLKGLVVGGGGAASRMPFTRCDVGLTFVRFETIIPTFEQGLTSTLASTPSAVPGSAGDLLVGCGLVAIGTLYAAGGLLLGVFSAAAMTQSGLFPPTMISCHGGRFGPTLFSLITSTHFESGGGNCEILFVCTVTIGGPNAMMRVATGSWRWQVTTGNCITLTRGGAMSQDVGAPVSGGTGDPNGFGIDVRGGGRVWTRATPTLTGGTAGNDLRTSGATAPNSALAAVGAVGVASDALNGEVLARVA